MIKILDPWILKKNNNNKKTTTKQQTLENKSGAKKHNSAEPSAHSDAVF